jgi:hypothetical protein
MTTAEKVYLDLICSAIWSEESVKNFSGVSWSDVLTLAHKQGTLPLLYDKLLSLDYEIGMPADWKLWMQQYCMANILSQKKWEERLKRCIEGLNDVPLVLLKGFGLARYYPTPYLRQWGDLDVWVGVDNYHVACANLRQAFPEAIHHDEEWEELKHYCFVFPDEAAIELHRVTMGFASECDGRYYARLEKEGMSQVASIGVGEVEVNVPEDKFNMLFVFMHAWEHFISTGMPMKQLCDMALLAHCVYGQATQEKRKEMEQYLQKHLRKLHLLGVWKTVGYVLVHYLRLPSNEWPLYCESAQVVKYGERLFERVMREGQGRNHQPSVEREVARKMPILKRKWITLKVRYANAMDMMPYAPDYMWHWMWANVLKGIKRTIKRTPMVPY